MPHKSKNHIMYRLLANEGKIVTTEEVKGMFGGKMPSEYRLWMAGIHRIKH